jgi:maltose/moltooligosaccharide transporter
MMDASINISMEPFRAFVGDNLPDQSTGFCHAKFFIGLVLLLVPYYMFNKLLVFPTSKREWRHPDS